jgi:hypothetical protein
MRFRDKQREIIDDEELSFKDKCKRFLLKLLIMSVIGLLYAGIGFVIALWIANRNQYKLQDVAFSIGILIMILGFFMMMKGNPSGGGMSGWGSKNVTAISEWNLEILRQEREDTGYYRNFRNHAVMELTFNRFTFVLGGAFLTTFAVLFL